MFTGLIEHMGVVRSRGVSTSGERLVVDPSGWEHVPRVGDSVAVNGCCLTVVTDLSTSRGMLEFDVVPETLAKTTLGGLTVGQRVNLEHAATLATLLGGHLVQGHVDGVGRVVSVRKDGEWRVRIEVAADLAEYFAPKGSVCVDGVSLTVAALSGGESTSAWFEVALIPTTLEKTTLQSLAVGSRVNVECDAIGKQVVHWLRVHGGRVNSE